MSGILSSEHIPSTLTLKGPFAWNDRPSGAPLPSPLTSFVGREREIDITSELLLQPYVRLLTLTGTGGIGKTRLALQVASELTNVFPHGVGFVSLASLRDPELVAAAVGETLSLADVPGQRLVRRLQGSSPIDACCWYLTTLNTFSRRRRWYMICWRPVHP